MIALIIIRILSVIILFLGIGLKDVQYSLEENAGRIIAKMCKGVIFLAIIIFVASFFINR